MSLQINNHITILDYLPSHHARFRAINQQWILKHYLLEEEDRLVLEEPEEHVLNNGGKILMASYLGNIVGTCCLLNEGRGVFQLAKMAVDEQYRGLKIGKFLCLAAIHRAINLEAKKIVLYSDRHNAAIAIAMYKRMGFHEVPFTETHLHRSNIKMEWTLF